MRRPRFTIAPGDVPAALAARRMGLSERDFIVALPELLARGFPASDPTTGNFDLTAIDDWRRSRHSHSAAGWMAQNADEVVNDRVAALLANG